MSEGGPRYGNIHLGASPEGTAKCEAEIEQLKSENAALHDGLEDANEQIR